MNIAHLDRVGKVLGSELERAAIWLLGDSGDGPEIETRVEKAYAVHRKWGLPIWVFGKTSGLLKEKLVGLGVHPAQISSSPERGDSLKDMPQVITLAKAKGVTRLVCISNPLHLLQVYGALRDDRERLVFVPTKLKDKRWWYLATRLALIPAAFAGAGKGVAYLSKELASRTDRRS